MLKPIPAREPLSKPLQLAPSAFELWAAREGYNIAPSCLRAISEPSLIVTLKLYSMHGEEALRLQRAW
jgi:hypothetical protein